MGACESTLVNGTGHPVFVVTYNAIDTVYWINLDARQLPANGDSVTVQGIAGGPAIKVAVIYKRFVDDKQYVCDLFWVEKDGCLQVEALTADSGVTAFSGRGASMQAKGKVVSLSFGDDFLQGLNAFLDNLVNVGLKAVPCIPALKQIANALAPRKLK